MELINQHIDELRKLCDEYNVLRLYVFGSVAKGEHDKTSDIDLLVEFSGVDPLDYFDN
ncbi:nucleotidyltransferase family protein, partial [Salibacter sp.]|uniref:nucleotidyltransferase family protein n=1 Tax=Salibacter sp. TaxID=2010995 RepID=UPI0038F78B17